MRSWARRAAKTNQLLYQKGKVAEMNLLPQTGEVGGRSQSFLAKFSANVAPEKILGDFTHSACITHSISGRG